MSLIHLYSEIYLSHKTEDLFIHTFQIQVKNSIKFLKLIDKQKLGELIAFEWCPHYILIDLSSVLGWKYIIYNSISSWKQQLKTWTCVQNVHVHLGYKHWDLENIIWICFYYKIQIIHIIIWHIIIVHVQFVIVFRGAQTVHIHVVNCKAYWYK